MIAPFVLAIIFIFTLALLMLGVIYSKINWIFKSALIIITLFVTFIFYQNYIEILGWPISTNLPEKFTVISYQAIEPSKINNEKGKIFIWLYMEKDSKIPRCIEIPYSKENHKKLEEAKEESAKNNGAGILMKAEPKSLKSQGVGKSNINDDENVELDFIPPETTPYLK